MTAAQTQPVPEVYDSPSERLRPGTRLLNGQYAIDRYLSSGGFGITYLARDSLDRIVVIKECYPEAICSRDNQTVRARSSAQPSEFAAMVDMFMREARSIAKLNHPNIVGVHQVFEDNDTAYMALDYIKGHDLLDIIQAGGTTMSPAKVRALLIKVLDAVALIHSQDMLHRDISPDNILMDQDGEPVLIDFGAARQQASKKSRALSALLVVKDGYSPQEFYISGSQQTACSDLYSLAATLVHLLTGEAPPNSQARLAAIAGHAADPYVPIAGRVGGYDPAFLEAVDRSMNLFPDDRLQSAQEWLEMIDLDRKRARALQHAARDATIERTVTELVTEVNTHMTLTPLAAGKAGANPTEAVVLRMEPPKPRTKMSLDEILEAERQRFQEQSVVLAEVGLEDDENWRTDRIAQSTSNSDAVVSYAPTPKQVPDFIARFAEAEQTGQPLQRTRVILESTEDIPEVFGPFLPGDSRAKQYAILPERDASQIRSNRLAHIPRVLAALVLLLSALFALAHGDRLQISFDTETTSRAAIQ